MTMKKWLTVLFACAVFCGAGVSVAAAAIEVTGDVYVGVYDKYLWRGIDLSAGQPVLQGGADVSFKGFTLSYWSNMQLSNGGEDFLDGGEITETDIVLDYTFSPVDLLSVSVGNITYTFNVPGTTNELYLGLGLDTILSPALTVYWDWDIADEGDNDMDGLYYVASVGHTFEIMETLGLNLSALASYNDESPYVADYSDWHNYELGISADYAITEQISVSPSFLYSDAISDEADDVIDDEILAGVSIALTF